MSETKSPIIIVCGPDKCGKTNIARALAKELRVPYYKDSREQHQFVNGMEAFYNDLLHADPARLDLLAQLNTGLVFDRGYPCEWVYSRFFNRRSSDAMIQWLDEKYAALGAKIVVPIRRSYEGIVDDLNPLLAGSQLQRLEDLYTEFLVTSRCGWIKLYVDDEDLTREVNVIMSFLQMGAQ